MNRHLLLAATTLAALLGAGSSFAAEGTQDFPEARALSTQARADVRAELAQAQRAGALSYGDASPAPVPASTLSRVQVLAEAREAQRLGLAGSNEAGVPVATPAQLEQIRMAGLRAIDATTVARSTTR